MQTTQHMEDVERIQVTNNKCRKWVCASAGMEQNKPVKTVTDEKHTVLLYLCNVTLRTNTRRCLRSNKKRLCEVQYGAAQRPKLTARGCRGLQHIGAPLNTHDDRHRPHRRVRG